MTKHKITLIPEVGWILVRKNKDMEGVQHEFLDASRLYCQPLQDDIKPSGMTAEKMADYMMKTHPEEYTECYPVYSPCTKLGQ